MSHEKEQAGTNRNRLPQVVIDIPKSKFTPGCCQNTCSCLDCGDCLVCCINKVRKLKKNGTNGSVGMAHKFAVKLVPA